MAEEVLVLQSDRAAYAILDDTPNPDFDRLVRLAATLCQCTQACLSFTDGQRHWSRSAVGQAEGGPAAVLALLPQLLARQTLVCHENLVYPGPLRFVATMPLRTRQGLLLGALTVAENHPRVLRPDQAEALEALAAQVLVLLEFGRQQALLKTAQAENHQAREALALQLETRRIAGQVARLGGWIWRREGPRFAWSPEVAHIHGLEENQAVTVEQVFGFYASEDQPRLDAAVRRCWRLGERFDLELRLQSPQGPLRWVRIIGESVRDGQGRICAIQGALEDIHERKLSEEALRDSEERFKLAARATADVVWDWDLLSDQLWWSQGLQRLFGIAAETLEPGSHSRSQRLHPEDRERVQASLAAVLQGRERQWADEYRFRRADGSYARVQDQGFVIRDAEGRARRMVGGLKDLTDQHRAREEARRDLQTRADIARFQQEIASADLDLDGVLSLMAEQARRLVQASGSSVELLEGQRTVCRAASGLLAQHLGLPVDLQASLSGQVIQQGRITRCDDTEQDPRVNLAISRSLGVRSLIVAPLMADKGVVGVMRVVSDQPCAFSAHDESNLQILVTTLGGVIQRHRLDAQLQASEAQYRQLFDHNPQPMWVHDIQQLRLLAVNQAMVDHYGYSAEELLDLQAPAFWADADAQSLQSRIDSIRRGDKHLNSRRRHRHKDGSLIEVEITASNIVFNDQPARLVIASDIGERLRTEQALLRVSRAQRVLSACNEALVRASTEMGLLEDVTRITVEIGGYRMAWVGITRSDEPGRWIRPVARFGAGTAFLDGLNVSWAEDSPFGNGPAGQALRSGETVIVEDLEASSGYIPWLERARPHGFKALVCLPLKLGQHSFGLFSLYAAETFEIGDDEVQLLQSLAKDLAFGIGNLRAQEEQRRLQHAVLKLATAVSASTGTAFFEQLVSNMTDALEAEAGFVVRLLPGQPRRAQVIAGRVQGQATLPNEYPLDGLPCDQLLRAGVWLVPDGLSRQARTAEFLPGAAAYVGRRLDNDAGEPVGLVFALFAKPLQQTGFIVSALHVFAARASAELARQAADAQIRDQASLLDRAQDAIIVRRVGGGLSYWNKGAERLYGFTAAEALDPEQGRRIERECLHFDEVGTQVLGEGEWSGEIVQHRRDGRVLTVESRWTLVRDKLGAPQSILSINTDITARKQAEQQIQRLAFFDALTELPNRQLLMDRLQHALASSARTGHGGALLFIDLDNFKTLNDTLGHDQGDALLRQVAQRLSGCVRESDTVARLGGDEFVVMLENLGQHTNEIIDHARRIGEKVLGVLSSPFMLEGHQHLSSCSIGVAPFQDGRHGIGDVLKQADLAMYQAKTAGRNTLRFFDPAMQAAVSARASLEASLRHALSRGEFQLHYQPQTEQGRQVSGVEALVRWRHPLHGMVSPAEFIPVAEDTGLIIPIGRWVLDTACALLAQWALDPHTARLSVAVNVSSRQFKHPDFVDHVVSALQQSGARPERLKLELTESLLVDDMEATIERMGLLKALGVGFSLDDFGTGYSSLSYLKRLPLDQLKIDQSFVRDVLTDPNDAAIVRTIITLGRSLGLAVIAEGVESPDQQDFLARHDCHAFQGYAFGRPMPQHELSHFLASRALH
ncbi:MAG: EAL domain-containing protein [Curvibacter sp.]|nr:EAL domain-containing protein [Curvibacter sp.]